MSNPVSPELSPYKDDHAGLYEGDEEEGKDRSATPVEEGGVDDDDRDRSGPSGEVVSDDVEGLEDGDEAEEEHERQRTVRRPEAPTKEEIAEHRLTHIPMRPWCRHCMRGKGKRRPSRSVTGEFAEEHVPHVRLDYSPLDDKSGADAEDDGDDGCVTQTVLVMQESQCGSVWSYAVEHKGGTEQWVIDQICEDLETVGLRNERVIVKTDQEASANDIAREVARNRSAEYGTALDNSSVGASDTNATVEKGSTGYHGSMPDAQIGSRRAIAVSNWFGASHCAMAHSARRLSHHTLPSETIRAHRVSAHEGEKSELEIDGARRECHVHDPKDQRHAWKVGRQMGRRHMAGNGPEIW